MAIWDLMKRCATTTAKLRAVAGTGGLLVKNWAKYANRWNMLFWGFLSGALVVAIVVEPVHGWTLLGVLGLATFCALQWLSAFTGKLVVTDDGLVSRTWFRTRTFDWSKISSLTQERWDGGWLLFGHVPKRIRVLCVRVQGSHGEVIVLEHAFMPRKQLDQLVTEVRSRSPRKIKGHNPANNEKPMTTK